MISFSFWAVVASEVLFDIRSLQPNLTPMEFIDLRGSTNVTFEVQNAAEAAGCGTNAIGHICCNSSLTNVNVRIIDNGSNFKERLANAGSFSFRFTRPPSGSGFRAVCGYVTLDWRNLQGGAVGVAGFTTVNYVILVNQRGGVHNLDL
jgi:hypothetical protein